MSAPRPNPYLRDAVLTATPEQLQLMLYDGAIRFATQGREAVVRKDYETSYEKFTRAQQIVLEMYKGLNFEVNAELCQRMASVYLFIYNKLVDACVRRETQHADDALKVLRIERETWKILVDKVAGVTREDGTGAAEAGVVQVEEADADERVSESEAEPARFPGSALAVEG